MKTFCYILSFRFLRIYLICWFWWNDIHLAVPAMRAELIHVPFSPISRENFLRSCRKLLSKKSIQSRYHPYLLYFLSGGCGNKLPRSKGWLKSPKRESFFLIEPGNCTASFRINECKIPSERNCFGVRSWITSNPFDLVPERVPLNRPFRYLCRYIQSGGVVWRRMCGDRVVL